MPTIRVCYLYCIYKINCFDVRCLSVSCYKYILT